jgi:hypothetical protein
MMADIPEAYMGQPRRTEPEGYTIETDLSSPSQPGKETVSTDALNPEAPAGSFETGKPIVKKPKVRWFRGRR